MRWEAVSLDRTVSVSNYFLCCRLVAKLSRKVFARLPKWIWPQILTNYCSVLPRMTIRTSYIWYWSANVYWTSKRSYVPLGDNFLPLKTHIRAYMSSACVIPDIKLICISYNTALRHANVSTVCISMRNMVFCYPFFVYRYLRLYRH